MRKNEFSDLLVMSRFSHYVKNIFVVPGLLAAVLLTNSSMSSFTLVVTLFSGFLSISLAASANYVLNEYLDRKTDVYHPKKSNRPATAGRIRFESFFFYYLTITALALSISIFINDFFIVIVTIFLMSGLIYNVKPIRLKDRYLLDVISESFNNVLRFLAGWFLITQIYLPPLSLVLSYWWIGAFLMTAKRLAEIQSFDSIEQASKYRLSFSHYSISKLTSLSFLYGCLALMSFAVFSAKWEPESIFLIPILSLIFTYYFHVSKGVDSIAQNPENLWKDRKLVALISLLIVQLILVLSYDYSLLSTFVQSDLITIKK